MVFCICSGDAFVSLPRYKNVKSLIVSPPEDVFTSTLLTIEVGNSGHFSFQGPLGATLYEVAGFSSKDHPAGRISCYNEPFRINLPGRCTKRLPTPDATNAATGSFGRFTAKRFFNQSMANILLLIINASAPKLFLPPIGTPQFRDKGLDASYVLFRFQKSYSSSLS